MIYAPIAPEKGNWTVTDLCGTLVDFLEVLLVVMPAAWKIVRLLSAVGVRCVVTLMHRNETVIVVYLHGIGIVDYLDTLADILYRYAVVM